MVVSLDSIKRAVASFMETDILPKASQDKRFIIGALIIASPKIIEKKYDELHDYIELMEIGTSDGMIDIDRAESVVCGLMGKYGDYQINIGNTHICLGQSDMNKLAQLARSM